MKRRLYRKAPSGFTVPELLLFLGALLVFVAILGFGKVSAITGGAIGAAIGLILGAGFGLAGSGGGIGGCALGCIVGAIFGILVGVTLADKMPAKKRVGSVEYQFRETLI